MITENGQFTISQGTKQKVHIHSSLNNECCITDDVVCKCPCVHLLLFCDLIHG